MLIESYQTSPPMAPLGSNVAAVLAPKAMTSPSATGTSIPIRLWRRSRQADSKNGRQENSSTGKVRIHEAQRSSAWMSGVISPGCAT